MDIRGAVAVVTGSSSVIGIGAEIAKLLGARGCNVVVNYAGNKAGAEETAALCRKGGAEAITVQGDVSIDADCRRLVKSAIDKWGQPAVPRGSDRFAGKHSVTVVPWPSALSKASLPPCSSTIALTSGRPRPVP